MFRNVGKATHARLGKSIDFLEKSAAGTRAPSNTNRSFPKRMRVRLSLAFSGVILVSSCAGSGIGGPTNVEETGAARSFDSSVLSEINRAITKPSELIQFSSFSATGDSGSYRDLFENNSYECNAVVDLQYLAGAATGPSWVRASMHPAFGAVTDSKGLGFRLSNRPDVLSAEGVLDSLANFEAGIDEASVNVWVSWLLMPTAEEAQGLIDNFAQWVEPCGNLSKQTAIDVGDIGSGVTNQRDDLLAFQLIEGEPGFIMERSQTYETRWSDGHTSGFGSTTSVFMTRVSNVIVVATLFEDENADRILGIDPNKAWEGTWNLVQQSGNFLIQNQSRD